jgi:hypothetical protein
MAFCLVPKVAEDFKQKIIDGTIDPAALSEMSSADRRAFFTTHLGESNAEPVNALFESKLLLKNQQAGMINWAKKMMGDNPTAQRDIISKIQRLDKVLQPENQQAFLEDLVAQRLGTHVSYEEAAKITELTKAVQDTKGVGNRMDYGRAVVALNDYVNQIKLEANKFSLAEFKKNPLGSVGKGLSEVAGNAKAIKASMDNSAIFRQGWKTLWTNPGIWANNALQSFANIIKTFGKDQVMSELHADIVSRPTYDMMKTAKLAVANLEEAYPTTLPEKIPLFGKLYKASENAFTAFVQKTRADVFDKYIKVAQKTGVELSEAELKSIGKLVNSLTGRGNLGALEPVANVINNVFFSPRMLKSHIDTLTQPFTGAGGSNFVRKTAAFNLLKIIMGTAAVLGVAKLIKKDSVELDPRSADFGKIKIGNTRFDVTGGMDSVATLAARVLTLSSKSTATGQVNKLNATDKTGKPKFGAQTGTDVVYNFFENKLSPVSSVIKDLLKGQTFASGKPTIKNEAANLLVPLPITTAIELYQTPGSANKLLGIIADALGFNVNSYAPPPPKKKK